MRAFILTLFLLIPGAALASPQQPIEVFHQAISTLSGQGEASFDQRVELLEPIVAATHDMPGIARMTLGRDWASLNAEEQQSFVAAFNRLAVATYVARFPDLDPARFRIVDQQDQRRGVVRVRAELTRPDDDPLHFDYLVRDRGDGWKIVNILVNGVSDLALKRAEYGGILNRHDFATLVSKLERQYADLVAK